MLSPSRTTQSPSSSSLPGTAVPALEKSQPHRRPEVKRRTPQERWAAGVDWPVVAWISLAHAGLVLAPFYFTWKALALCAVLVWLTGSIGVCLGYHRCLTHGSFSTYRPIRWFLALCGQLSGEGSALMWVANHREHHLYSDKPGDPHSPRDGVWWSHLLWFMPALPAAQREAHLQRYAPDAYKDPMMRFLHAMFLPTHLLLGTLLLGAGWLGWDWYTGISFLVWGMSVRIVYVFHVTWLINSATHIWGYRNYETSDDSRNLWWVGLLAFGEGWHNNHHAFQRVARQGHKWWEVDVTYWTILALERLGLVWNVVKQPGPALASRAGSTTRSSAKRNRNDRMAGVERRETGVESGPT